MPPQSTHGPDQTDRVVTSSSGLDQIVSSDGSSLDEHLINKPNQQEQQEEGTLCFMPISTLLWLIVFCVTGIGLGMCWEFLELHAGPAKPQTFITCFIGYWTQVLVGGAWALTRPNGWTNTISMFKQPSRVIGMLFISALFDGCAQSLNYVGQYEGGQMLFTIFHASVTFFTAVIAVLVLRVYVTPIQWVGVFLVVGGLFATAIPQHIQAEHSYFWGVTASAAGSFCLAASYPFSELVFKQSESVQLKPPSEESACLWGSLINAIAFSIWTLAYTVPKWDELVKVENVCTGNCHPDITLAWVGYIMVGFTIGLHSLSFWKSVNLLGTVPTAVSKGAQQAGVFVFSHIIFCHYDSAECIDNNYGDSVWHHMQKSVAFVLCASGAAIYSLNKYQEKQREQQHDQESPKALAYDCESQK